MLGFSADFAASLDHDDGLQPRPVMTLLKPSDIVDDSGGPGLDTAVVTVDGGVAGGLCIGEAAGFLLGDENLDILAQRSLIAFQRENVISLLVDDLCAMSRWHPIASMVTIAPSIVSISRSLGIAMISLDFSATLTCPRTSR